MLNKIILGSLFYKRLHTTETDRASQALAKELPSSIPSSYCVHEDHTSVPSSTLHHHSKQEYPQQSRLVSHNILIYFVERQNPM